MLSGRNAAGHLKSWFGSNQVVASRRSKKILVRVVMHTLNARPKNAETPFQSHIQGNFEVIPTLKCEPTRFARPAIYQPSQPSARSLQRCRGINVLASSTLNPPRRPIHGAVFPPRTAFEPREFSAAAVALMPMPPPRVSLFAAVCFLLTS